MKKVFNRMMNLSILSSVLFVMLGLFLYIKPTLANKLIGYTLGSLVLLMGISSVYKYVLGKKKAKIFAFDMMFGILSILLGLFIIINPLSINTFLTVGLGIWMSISGLLKLKYAQLLKKFHEDYWSLAFVVALIHIIFGLLLIFNPFRGGMLISELIGLFIIAYGILNITETALFKKNINTISKVIVRRK